MFEQVRHFPRAMPQFPVGYDGTIERLREGCSRHSGLVLCGGAVGALGLPDCITSGRRAGAEVVDFVASRPESIELAV